MELVRGIAPKQDTWQCAYKPGHRVLRILFSILGVMYVKQNMRHYAYEEGQKAPVMGQDTGHMKYRRIRAMILGEG
jgi:hypothetical protein